MKFSKTSLWLDLGMILVSVVGTVLAKYLQEYEDAVSDKADVKVSKPKAERRRTKPNRAGKHT